ncbi:hypothetical protein GCM10011491_06100 [Brucella endophytica]|uniref:DUF3175 domain-containing protein n=1 Tax=Brucella endophytica TaxID=1963359 RepID=A0A916S3V8_9HYPH|nr:DUF3175 domain-containing protein [Brucella endophytica]GGA81568.1 hypothetical protein GCM10011491_06100 [Brucella endophytica]
MVQNMNKWSKDVTEHDNPLDLKTGVFARGDAQEIAAMLQRSAEEKGDADPYRSAMSMLDFYINRAGRNLPAERETVLEEAKSELRRLYDRTA